MQLAQNLSFRSLSFGMNPDSLGNLHDYDLQRPLKSFSLKKCRLTEKIWQIMIFPEISPSSSKLFEKILK
jgi:hypothetical protein